MSARTIQLALVVLAALLVAASLGGLPWGP
jgi:hypothetical protein